MQSLFLRRYSAMLLHLEPTQREEHVRHVEALAQAERMTEFAEEEARVLSGRPYTEYENDNHAEGDTSNHDHDTSRPRRSAAAAPPQAYTRDEKDAASVRSPGRQEQQRGAAASRWRREAALLRRFESDVIWHGRKDRNHRPTDVLRNVVHELRFWQRHPELWYAHVMQLATPLTNTGAQTSAAAAAANEDEVDVKTNDAGAASMLLPDWGHSLSPFRGSYCFQGRPELRVRSHAANSTKGARTFRPGQTSSAATPHSPRRPDDDASDTTVHMRSSASHKHHRFASPFSYFSQHPRLDALSASVLRQAETVWVTEHAVFALSVAETCAEDASSPVMAHAATHAALYRFSREDQYNAAPVTVARIRQRLVYILKYIHETYVRTNHRAWHDGLPSWLWSWLSPLSWWRYVRHGKDRSMDTMAFHAAGLRDPGMQLVTAEVTGAAWGGLEDVPFKMMKNLLLQPPELLRLKTQLQLRIYYGFVLALAFLLALVVAYNISPGCPAPL